MTEEESLESESVESESRWSELDLPLCYVWGVMASASPCVVVLVPLLLYRFKNGVDGNVALLLGGFLLSYVFFGLTASSILTSSLQNGLKLGLGAAFVVTGRLAALDRVNPFHFPAIDHPFVFGLCLAAIISLNPCTLPFLALVISLHTSNAMVALVLFGLGLLTPSVLFLLLGRASLKIFSRYSYLFYMINRAMNVVLSLTGFYLLTTISLLTKWEALIGNAVFGLTLYLMFTSLEVPWRRSLVLSVAVAAASLAWFWISRHDPPAHAASEIQHQQQRSNYAPKCPDPNTPLLQCSPCGTYLRFFQILMALILIGLFVFVKGEQHRPQDGNLPGPNVGQRAKKKRTVGLSPEEEELYWSKLDAVRRRIITSSSVMS